jgi:K+-transporting ATPase ATPase C chain
VRQIRTAAILLGVFMLLLGVIYPLVLTGIAQALFPFRANGSLVRRPPAAIADPGSLTPGIIGSELIGQSFSAPGHFHGRPSDCSYNAAGSASANLGPSNPALFRAVQARIDSVRAENGLDKTAPVPADLVLASASGLDPDISPSAALLQIVRVAHARNVEPETVRRLVDLNTRRPLLGLFGPSLVNVLKLNLALDSMSQGKSQ